MIKHVVTLSLLLLAFTKLNAQNENKAYNKVLADSLGADDYGMKGYVFVILKTGEKTYPKPTQDSLFKGHMENMGRMVKAGKLIVAGPMGKNDKNYRGIFILNVKTEEEAKQLLDTDPAVKAQVLDAEIYKWYGSAALPLYLNSQDKVQKKSF